MTGAMVAGGRRARRTTQGDAREQQLLDAGLRAVAERPAHALLPSRAATLRATEDDELGPASSGSFRNAFGSLEEFHRRLIAERLLVTHPAVPETEELLTEVSEALAGDSAVNLADLAARVLRQNLETNLAQRDMEQTRLLCLLAGIAPGGEQAAAAARDDYRDFTERFAALYEEILDGWGRHLREPFDTRSLAVIIAALADGLTLRHLVDPDAVDPVAYQHVVVCLLLLLVAPAGDDRGVEQLIAEVFPQPSAE